MIKKTYYWKEITDDGLVKEPPEIGPHYSPKSLNDWGGHDSKEEAFKQLEHINKTHQFGVPSSLTLIIKYQVIEEGV